MQTHINFVMPFGVRCEVCETELELGRIIKARSMMDPRGQQRIGLPRNQIVVLRCPTCDNIFRFRTQFTSDFMKAAASHDGDGDPKSGEQKRQELTSGHWHRTWELVGGGQRLFC